MTLLWSYRGADVQDLYVMDAVNFTHYMMNGSLETFDIHEEVIKVNTGKDRVIKVRTSRFGPVVTDNNVVDDIDTPLSLKWTAIDPDVPDTTVKAFMLTNFAHSFEDFQNAMMFFTGPSQNFVYADKGGNIAYQLSGQIPIRSDSHKGAWPVPGNGKQIRSTIIKAVLVLETKSLFGFCRLIRNFMEWLYTI